MPNNATRIAAAKKKIDIQQDQIVQFTILAEQAADTGNVAEVQKAQAEITARELIVKRTKRLVSDMQRGKSKEDIAEAQGEITTSKATVIATTEQIGDRVKTKVAPAISTLVAALVEVQALGAQRGEAGRAILKLMPQKDRRRFDAIVSGLALSDTSIGALLDGELQRAGVFETLCPAPWVVLRNGRLPAIADGVAHGNKRLLAVVEQMVELASAEVCAK